MLRRAPALLAHPHGTMLQDERSRVRTSGVLAMAIVVNVAYENGVLKPAEALPLGEHKKVRVTIESETSWAERTAGMLHGRVIPRYCGASPKMTSSA